MPIFDIIPLRTVAPAHNMPGGGNEACTRGIVYLYGIYNFDTNQYDL